MLKQGMASAPIPPGELAQLQSVAAAFDLPAPVARIEPLGNGNVNATYRVHLVGAEHGSTVLQRLNTAVTAPATGAEVDALRAVRSHDAVTMTALAGRLGLDRTTVSRVVGRLEELGLVRRTADDADQRRSWVSVAPAGRRLLTALDQVSINDYVVATSEWSATERMDLGHQLARLKRDLQRLEFDADGRAIGLTPLSSHKAGGS